jgi:hypothetical protein
VFAGIGALLISIFLWHRDTILTKPVIVVVLLMPLVLLAWIWIFTYYIIEKDKVWYHLGPFRGSIDVNSIREITKNKTLWVGFRPALALKGLIIRYNTWDDIYFSPKDKEAFVAKLLSKNPAIVVKDATAAASVSS